MRWIVLENFRLRVFRAVAEEMSFRKAAEVLHLSQPAVSQQIRALEEEAGVRLFDRAGGEGHGTQIALTEAGRVLLGYAKTAAVTMEEAQRALAALNDEMVGSCGWGLRRRWRNMFCREFWGRLCGSIRRWSCRW